ncbi:MAG: DUF2382 domain-containing protein [Janthinobacterium lividum]
MSKTVVGLFDDFQDAQRVVQNLTNAGFRREDISIAANQTATGYTGDGTDFGADAGAGGHAVGKDAGVGAGVGGVVGLLVGLGLLTVPGIGPILAAGPIVAALGTAVGSTVVGAGVGAVAGGLIGGLTHIGVPKDHAEYYAEGVRRGGTLVTVDAADDQAEAAVDIMNSNGAVDIDSRGTSYRTGGYTGFDESASPYASEDITRERDTYRTAQAVPPSYAADTTAFSANTPSANAPSTSIDTQGGTIIPIVEEELQVGKRQVQRGGARIHTYVTERPIEESVSLHEEHVTVSRRTVDRPAGEADLAFGEKSFEVLETAEVPVVAKTSRVVEEVVVGKTATDRTETVRDTVRRTDVDIDEMDDDDTLDASRTTTGTRSTL